MTVASITIRNLDDDVKTRLRIRAAEHHRSMEEEARLILHDAVVRKPSLSNGEEVQLLDREADVRARTEIPA